MQHQYDIRKTTSIAQMLFHYPLVQQLSPQLTIEDYARLIQEMIPHNYFQVGVYQEEKCVAVSGCWLCTKLYSGKYMEIDNFVVDKEYRSQGVGKLLLDWMIDEAKRNDCKTVMLDAYVENFKVHRFYYREGFIARGFHYLKSLR
jgi:GNAT superfamily N-acetyltransferase